MQLESLSYQIRGAIFEVFKELGPGLLESVYEAALMKEFELVGIAGRFRGDDEGVLGGHVAALKTQ